MGSWENYEAFYQQPETQSYDSGPLLTMADLKKVILNPQLVLTKEGNGFEYVLYYGPEDNRRVYVSGWTAGTRREANEEARRHAGAKLRGYR